jgi:hypothetical protein
MANFLEFLKSGKSAREFIDTAVLPQHVLPVEHTGLSPEPNEPEPEESSAGGMDTVLDSATEEYSPEPPGAEDRAADSDSVDGGGKGLETVESETEADSAFLSALEAAEREGIA